MFRSHRHSFGRTHTVVLGLLAAGLLSTSVGAAAAPDRFVLAVESGADAGTRLLGRITPGVPGAASPETRHCFAEALTLIAGRSGCDGASADFATQAAPGTGDLAFTQGHTDVPQPLRRR